MEFASLHLKFGILSSRLDEPLEGWSMVFEMLILKVEVRSAIHLRPYYGKIYREGKTEIEREIEREREKDKKHAWAQDIKLDQAA